MAKVIKRLVGYETSFSMFIEDTYNHSYTFSDGSVITSIEDTPVPLYEVGESYLLEGRSVLQILTSRLKRIGIDITLNGNLPWVYLSHVNDIKVEGTYMAEHGFCAFMLPMKKDGVVKFTNRREVFNKIRSTLKEK